MITATDRIAHDVSQAACWLAERRRGALIIIEGRQRLDAIAANGVAIDATLSAKLLASIFSDTSPLANGAVIVRGDMVLAAACTVPLAQAPHEVPQFQAADVLGDRLRAARHVSENEDAIAIAVSRTRGIQLAFDGTVTPVRSVDALRQLLLVALRQRRPRTRVGLFDPIRRWLRYYASHYNETPIFVHGTIDGTREQRRVTVVDVAPDCIVFDDADRDQELELDPRLLGGDPFPCAPGDTVILHLQDDQGHWHDPEDSDGTGSAPVPRRPRPPVLSSGAARRLDAAG